MVDYHEYITSLYWKRKRIERLLLAETCDFPAGIKCEHRDCGLFVPLNTINVHHLTYDNLGHESMEDLAVYCRPCHAFTHGFPRHLWWDMAKRQGLKHATWHFIYGYKHIKKAGEVMFDCLSFAPKAKMELGLLNVKQGLVADAMKYTPSAV